MRKVRICSQFQCSRTYYAQGLCKAHYQRALRGKLYAQTEISHSRRKAPAKTDNQIIADLEAFLHVLHVERVVLPLEQMREAEAHAYVDSFVA